MRDYNFEILKLKKDKINYGFNFFIFMSVILIIIFIIVIFGTKTSRYITCDSVFNNNAGDFNYHVEYQIYNGEIFKIDAKQVVDLKLDDAASELFNLLNEDNRYNSYKGFSFKSIIDKDKRITLIYSLDLSDGVDYLGEVNALLGVSGIYINSPIDHIIRKLEYSGFSCEIR